jgi:hypothetical protein
MTEDRRGRILAALSAAGADSWSSVGLCAVCPNIVGVDGAGVRVTYRADEPVASRWLAFTPPALAAGVRAVFGYRYASAAFALVP